MPVKPYRAPRVVSRQKCLIDGCMRPEELANGRSVGGLCRGHRYRKYKNLPLDVQLKDYVGRGISKRFALVRAALDLAQVDSADDAAFARAVRRLLRVARQF